MSDDLDIAADRAQLFIDNAMRRKKPVGPAATGFCLWCDETLSNDTSRWCNADHRDLYEREQRRRGNK